MTPLTLQIARAHLLAPPPSPPPFDHRFEPGKRRPQQPLVPVLERARCVRALQLALLAPGHPVVKGTCLLEALPARERAECASAKGRAVAESGYLYVSNACTVRVRRASCERCPVLDRVLDRFCLLSDCSVIQPQPFVTSGEKSV